MVGLVVELLRRSWAQRFASSLNLNWQEKRSEVRRNSRRERTLTLQCLDNNDVLLLLESILQSSKEGTQKINATRGLRAVQEHLMYGCGYIGFEEAYHLYSSFSQFSCPEKQAFRDKLLDGVHGLPVYVITQPITWNIFVVLQNSSDMEKFLVDFTNSMVDVKNNC